MAWKIKKLVALSAFLLIGACSTGNLEKSKQDGKKPIYLDFAASAGITEDALAKFMEVSRMNGNSSGINSHAKDLKKLEKESAKIIADKIGANSEQIHFVPSATMANNVAILGVAYKNPKCHLITSKIEHKSILNAMKHLEENGYTVTYIDVDRHGNVDLNQLRKSITKNTKLISIQMFNSEIGTIQNMKEIGKIAKENNVTFHSDAAQSFCKYDIDVDDMNIDLLTVSGHKIGAPQGIAALYVKDNQKLQPVMFGSGDTLFPGTKPSALICAFAKAVEMFSFNKEQIINNFIALTSELSKIEKIHINSSSPSHIVSISIEGVLLSDILERVNGYSFSAGCSCLGQDKSNVIEAIDPEDKLPSCSIRISFSDIITENQLIDFAKTMKVTVEQLRKEKNVEKHCQSSTDDPRKSLSAKLDKIQNLIEKEQK
jgi:cysteine desulfurase